MDHCKLLQPGLHWYEHEALVEYLVEYNTINRFNLQVNLNSSTNSDINQLLSPTSALNVTEAFLSSSAPSLPLTEVDTYVATQSLATLIKQEYVTPLSPLSPSQSSSGLGSSLPSASPAQQSFLQLNDFLERKHDPLLAAASLNIKNEAYSPQAMDISN